MLKIGIIGAGAIGSLFGGLLQRAGADVTLVHRNPRVVSTIRRTGVRIKERRKTVRVDVKASLAPADLTTVDTVFFTVKAYDTRQAAEIHKNKIGRDTTILTLQNGLGNLETLHGTFKSNPIAAGSTTEAALALSPGLIVHTGTGETKVGVMEGRARANCIRVVRELNRAGISANYSDDMTTVIWEKAVLNSAINPVSAITGLRNGELLKVRPLRELMKKAIGEGALVAAAEGLKLEPSRVWVKAIRILKATSENRSSMLQDIMHKRRTEILELNGALANYGSRHSVPTPYNLALTSLVLGLGCA